MEGRVVSCGARTSMSSAPGNLLNTACTSGCSRAARNRLSRVSFICAAIGFTIYPGSEYAYEMMDQIAELAAEAKAAGLAVVIWSYPRGGGLSKDGETAMDVAAYAAHMAALLGAHIIKVKLPTGFVEQPEARKVYEQQKTDLSSLPARVAQVVKACFDGH